MLDAQEKQTFFLEEGKVEISESYQGIRLSTFDERSGRKNNVVISPEIALQIAEHLQYMSEYVGDYRS